jgi:hypothetical protein
MSARERADTCGETSEEVAEAFESLHAKKRRFRKEKDLNGGLRF